MKNLMGAVGAVLLLCSTQVLALTCVDEGSNTYVLEPAMDDAVLINNTPFYEIRVEEFKDEVTTIHGTWMQDGTGAIALLSVITSNKGDKVLRKLNLVQGSIMITGECK